MIILGNETYGLEPVPHSTSNEHLLYLLKDTQSEPVTCGVVGEAASTASHEPFEPGQSLVSLMRVRKHTVHSTCMLCVHRNRILDVVVTNIYCLIQQRKRNLPQTSYVELVLVVDNLRVSTSVAV